jgi:isopenicillin N synthase-like dioxygenase
VYAENVWPEDAADFRSRYEQIGVQTHHLGLILLEACARALGLPEDTFTAYTEGGPHVTRALRYLPLKPAQVGTGIVWGEEHTDFNLLTLLPGGRFYDPAGDPCGRPDAASGLYLRTRPSAEHPIGRRVYGVPPAGCMVAQVGQQLEILTGGRLQATPHEITAPAQPGYTRTSMAHFVHAHPLTLLRPLAAFRTPESIAAYRPPVLAGTYGTKTLVDIGLAPAEAIHALGYRQYGRLADARRAEGRLPGMG